MTEVLALLESRLGVMSELSEALADLDAALQERSPGRRVAENSAKAEALLQELSRLEKTEADFLRKNSGPNLREYVQAQPTSPDRDEAMRLFFEIEDLYYCLKEDVRITRTLLERAGDFAAYHLNILSETRAETTYGPPSGTQGNITQGRKMFEANV